jgi:hypothetical protein
MNILLNLNQDPLIIQRIPGEPENLVSENSLPNSSNFEGSESEKPML